MESTVDGEPDLANQRPTNSARLAQLRTSSVALLTEPRTFDSHESLGEIVELVNMLIPLTQVDYIYGCPKTLRGFRDRFADEQVCARS